MSYPLLLVSAEDSQKLYVRLFLRKRWWIRKSKIIYNDIATDLSSILDHVTSCGLIEDGLWLVLLFVSFVHLLCTWIVLLVAGLLHLSSRS